MYNIDWLTNRLNWHCTVHRCIFASVRARISIAHNLIDEPKKVGNSSLRRFTSNNVSNDVYMSPPVFLSLDCWKHVWWQRTTYRKLDLYVIDVDPSFRYITTGEIHRLKLLCLWNIWQTQSLRSKFYLNFLYPIISLILLSDDYNILNNLTLSTYSFLIHNISARSKINPTSNYTWILTRRPVDA